MIINHKFCIKLVPFVIRRKANYMAMFRDRKAGQIQNKKMDNNSFEMVEEFKYLGKPLTNQNSIQKEIKSLWKSGNVFYNSVQNLLSSSFLSKNEQIKTKRTTVLPTVLYGYETWSLTLREELRLRVLENRLLRSICGPKGDEVRGNGEHYILSNLVICTPHQIFSA